MAGKRPTRPTAEPNEVPQKKKNGKGRRFFHNIKAFFTSNRFQIAVGVILLLFCVYLSVSFLSFFFTGKQDFSIIDHARTEQISLHKEILNWGGVPGAYLTHFFVQNAFGLAVPALYSLFLLLGIHLSHIYKVCKWRRVFMCLFLTLWGSTVLSFFQQTIFSRFSAFFYWGGAHGEFVAGFLLKYTHIIGTILILTAVAFVFLLFAIPQSVALMGKGWRWFISLFKRKKRQPKPVEEQAEDENIPEVPEPDNNDSTTPDIQTDEGTKEVPKNDIEIQINETEPTEEQDEPSQETELEVATPVETELSPADPDYILKTEGPYDPKKDLLDYQFPSTSLLKVYDNETRPVIDQAELIANKNSIVAALNSFGIEIQGISATVGPTITLYEIILKAGTKISKVQSLEKDLMAALSALGIRIIAPIPGKNAVGIEVPNKKPQIVSIHSVIASKKFQEEKDMALPIAIGKTITNEIFMFDLAKTPHLLVAGATGMGKSVGLNAILTSLLYKKHPAEMKLVLIDPKMVEFAPYAKLARHYLATIPGQEKPIITESNKTIETLNSLVQEMEDRYRLLEAAGCRKLEEYNDKFINRRLNPNEGHRYMPYIVIVIDEFGDFIMVAGKEVERPIQRLAQKARAVGMHMILATQRPTVSIITGNIKANVPTRIAFRVQSQTDSRTVLDAKGAEQLVYKGDMLYAGDGKDPVRVQCAFVDTPEVEEVLNHVQSQHGYAGISYELPEYVPENGESSAAALAPGAVDLKHLDPMFTDVARYVVQTGQGGTTNLQRKFAIGFQKAGRLMDQLEATGVVGPANGPKPRQVLITDEDELDALLHRLF